MLGICIFNIILLLSSQFTKEWYEGGSGNCTWKGDSSSIYSSKCYSHNNYEDSDCAPKSKGIDCRCCADEVSVHKLGHSLLPLIILMIFNCIWMGNFIVCCFREVSYDGYYIKLFKILNIPAAFLAIIVFSVESFGLTDEKIKAGMGLRITAIVIFALFSVALFWLSDTLKGRENTSLFSHSVQALPLMIDKGPDKPYQGKKFEGKNMMINRDDSLNEEFR